MKNQMMPTSRYNYSKVYRNGNKLVFGIYKRKYKSSFATSDKYYEISKAVEYRPDLVSYYAYGVPDFWWKIMEMNGMKDILEFKSGRNIRLPDRNLM